MEICVGNAHQNLKSRMQQHFNETKKLHQSGIRSDSYAKHFAEQLMNFSSLFPTLQRNSIECSIIWQGNPISAVKSFGTTNCSLCSRERLEILKTSRTNQNKLINSCNEIYGACRHKPRFHRYIKAEQSTDDSDRMKESKHRKVTTEV